MFDTLALGNSAMNPGILLKLRVSSLFFFEDRTKVICCCFLCAVKRSPLVAFLGSVMGKISFMQGKSMRLKCPPWAALSGLSDGRDDPAQLRHAAALRSRPVPRNRICMLPSDKGCGRGSVQRGRG